jgi:hypothetical protein
LKNFEMEQNEPPAAENEPPRQTMWSGLTHIAHNIVVGMEYVGKIFSVILSRSPFTGEMVAGIIGLDDSKFQDVIDNMTAEDWKVAIQVSGKSLLDWTQRRTG